MFCGHVLGLGERWSEEDLIPKWADKLLRRSGEPMNFVLSQRQLNPDGEVMGETTHRRRQTVSVFRFEGVCEGCNTRWMSQIERAAKDLLEPMISGVRSGLRVREQIVIARWMALKTLVVDLPDHGHPTFDLDDYRAFYEDPNLADGFFMARLGRIDRGDKGDHYISAVPRIAMQGANGVKAGAALALEFSFSIGPVYFQAALANKATAQYPATPILNPSPWWTQIWPQDHEVSWPPPYSFTPDTLPNKQGEWPEAAKWIANKFRRGGNTGASSRP